MVVFAFLHKNVRLLTLAVVALFGASTVNAQVPQYFIINQTVGASGSTTPPIGGDMLKSIGFGNQTNFGTITFPTLTAGQQATVGGIQQAPSGGSVTYGSNAGLSATLSSGVGGLTAFVGNTAGFFGSGSPFTDGLTFLNTATYDTVPNQLTANTDVTINFGNTGVAGLGVRINAFDITVNPTAVTATVNFNDGSPADVHAFGLVTFPPFGATNTSNAPYFGIVSTTGRTITSVVFSLAASTNSVVLDSLDFLVPEPGSIALFGVGLSGLALMGYRQRRQKLQLQAV